MLKPEIVMKNLNCTIFWNMMLCSLVDSYGHFEVTCFPFSLLNLENEVNRFLQNAGTFIADHVVSLLKTNLHILLEYHIKKSISSGMYFSA
jgi:hypothetical protein